MPAFLALIKSRRLNIKIRIKTDKELILDRITDPQSRFSTRMYLILRDKLFTYNIWKKIVS